MARDVHEGIARLAATHGTSLLVAVPVPTQAPTVAALVAAVAIPMEPRGCLWYRLWASSNRSCSARICDFDHGVSYRSTYST
jgi:hypothetical protein